MNNFLLKFEKILEILKQFETKSNFLNQIRLQRLSDIELIAVDLTAQSFGIDSEHSYLEYFLKQLGQKLNVVFTIVEDVNCFLPKSESARRCRKS